MQPIKLTLLNPDSKPRWYIKISLNENNIWEVEEDVKYSLFHNPLATGKTPGQALDNFLKVETELINNL